MTLSVGSLFSGIGGLELGLERTGYFKTEWQVETDEYANLVLEKHWPDVWRWGNIFGLTGDLLGGPGCVDIITAGFPCQNISCAGDGTGIHGVRSGLFYEAIRIIRDIRPRYILLENVAALLGRGIGDVLAEIYKSGYNAEWDCIPAQAFGAPHRRDRVFVVAYAQSPGIRTKKQPRQGDGIIGESKNMADTGVRKLQGLSNVGRKEISTAGACGRNVPDAEVFGRKVTGQTRGRRSGLKNTHTNVSNTTGEGLEGEKSKGSISGGSKGLFAERSSGEWWDVEPDVGRVADGVSKRVDRLRCLGNAVVPQVAQFIGECIKEFDRNNK